MDNSFVLTFWIFVSYHSIICFDALNSEQYILFVSVDGGERSSLPFPVSISIF